MRLLRNLLLFSLFIHGLAAAQPAGRQVHDKVAAQLTAQYNRKQFDSIYEQLSDAFKASQTRPDFTAFLRQNVYEPLGPILQYEFLQAEELVYAYVLDFKAARLRMNLALNTTGQIEGLQFLPYTGTASKTITLNYAFDNKKQSALDLLVDSTVRSFMQSPQNCGLSIGILKNGAGYFYNYGETKRGNKRLPRQNTIYEIGSLTKTFCGLLLAQAVTEKKVSPNDDIRDYLPGNYPGLEWNGKPILLKHLVSHSSGLPGVPENISSLPGFDSLNPYKNYSLNQLFDYLKRLKLSREPGQLCEYSNLGMSLLGIILEGVYNKPFESLVRENICNTNQMNSTAIQLTGEQLSRFADGYNQDGEPTPHWELNRFSAAGGLRSTTGDLEHYLGAQLAEADKVVALSHQPVFTGRETVAMAWFIKKTPAGNTLFWHNGATYGSSSFCGFIKEKNCAVIILSNTLGSVDHIAIALLNYLQQ